MTVKQVDETLLLVSWLDVNFHTYMAGTDIGSNCYSKALIGVCLRIFQ